MVLKFALKLDGVASLITYPNPKLSRDSLKNLFSAWVWKFLRKGGAGSQIQTLWGTFYSLCLDIFLRKGGRGWLKSKLFEELLPAWNEAGKKSSLIMSKDTRGWGGGQGGSAKVQSRAAVSPRVFPNSETLHFTQT